MFVCPASSWSSSGCVPTRAQGIGESVLVLGASLQTSAVSFTPTRHGQVLGSFVELVGPIDRRLRFSAGLSAPGSRPADAGFERCPAWVAKRDERIRNRAGDFRSGRLPGSKLWRFPTSLERKVRKASTVARHNLTPHQPTPPPYTSIARLAEKPGYDLMKMAKRDICRPTAMRMR
jgi:hypothetical protein